MVTFPKSSNDREMHNSPCNGPPWYSSCRDRSQIESGARDGVSRKLGVQLGAYTASVAKVNLAVCINVCLNLKQANAVLELLQN